MIDHILYLSATSCLVIGSSLTFKKDDEGSYFFLVGSSLFFIKSLYSCIKDTYYKQPKIYTYETI